jgi:GrpB-like predicted nucleotidyltransferase (UPF0157 family)
VLVPSNSSWSKAFEREASHLKLVMKDRLLGTEHVVSTAIPGIRAKPILDIMIGVANLTDGPGLAPVLAELK